MQGKVPFQLESACLEVLKKTYPDKVMVMDYQDEPSPDCMTGYAEFILGVEYYRVTWYLDVVYGVIHIRDRQIELLKENVETNTH